MIIEVEERFGKMAKQFSKILVAIKQAAKRGDAVHEVEEATWFGLIEVGREMIAAHIKQQDEELPRPKVGAQAVLSLRAIYLNDDWNAFHAARIKAEQRKLYPYERCLQATLNCAN